MRRSSDRPSLIACRTIIGKGAPNLQGTEKTHGAPLGDAEIAAARIAIDWPHRPFEVPEAIVETWRNVARRGADERREWCVRVAAIAALRRIQASDPEATAGCPL